MMLTPKARRFIREAVTGSGSPHDREIFMSWDQRTLTGEADAEILRIADSALGKLETHMFARLAPMIDEDDRVDLMNDLAFLRAVLRAVREARAPATAA